VGRKRDHAGVWFPPPLLYAIPFAAGIALHHAVGHDRIPASTAVVTGGPYRFTRNPMYVAMALLYLGLPPVLGYAWPYLFFPAAVLAVNAFVIPREERYLEEKFGEPYRVYRGIVRRWL
jgi:protein-S-isoprenylcysteine O-methyltransferase Ste14